MDYKKPNTTLYNIPFTSEQFNGMPYRNLGTSGLKVSNVGLGTWKIGYPETGDGSRINAKDAFRLFDRAIELGVTFWDTANRYNGASGNSERVIGTWLKNNPDQRRNVILATKLFGSMDGLTPNHCGLSRTNIVNSVYASLERLQTDYIDLLYFHAFDNQTLIEESLMAIEDMVKMDKIKYFAVSNFTVDQLKSYRQVPNTTIRSRVVAIQNQFNILEGEPDPYKGTLEYASQENISYIAWSPLARGLLTGKYLDLAKVGPGDRLFDEKANKKYNDKATRSKILQLAKLSKEWDLEINQLSLAYMLTISRMGPVIPSSSNILQLESNAKAGKIILSEGQKNRITEILK